jgi:hypothetical protein
MLPVLLAAALAADAPPPAALVDHAAARLLARAGDGEPAIGDVQRAAARTAVTGEISGWRSRPRLAALLPELTAELRVDQQRYRTVGLTSTAEVDYARDSPGTVMGVRLRWDLSELVWTNAELPAGHHAAAAARVRDEAVERATRLYYERQRLLVEVAAEPAADARARAEQELRLEELAAELDVLTGGLYARGGR